MYTIRHGIVQRGIEATEVFSPRYSVPRYSVPRYSVMDSIIYLVGLIVIVMFILSLLGLH
jgi:hypothetical protein